MFQFQIDRDAVLCSLTKDFNIWLFSTIQAEDSNLWSSCASKNSNNTNKQPFNSWTKRHFTGYFKAVGSKLKLNRL